MPAAGRVLQSSYKDFVIEQTAVKEDERIKTYWQNELSEYKRLELPWKSKTAAPGKGTGRFKLYALDSELVEQVKVFSAKNRISVRALCFSAYAYMLSLFAYEQDFTVGVIESNRPVGEDGDKILGCFLNSVPVRVRLDRDADWSSFAAKQDAKLKEIKAMGKLPFQDICKQLGEAPADENPLFDTVFNFVDFHVYEGIDRKSVQAETLELEQYAVTNTWLDVTVSTTFDQWSVCFHYHDHRADEAFVGELSDYFTSVLRTMVQHPSLQMSRTGIFSPELTSRLEQFSYGERVAYEGVPTLSAMFAERFASYPNHTAIVFEQQSLTYRELDQRSAAVAAHLRRQGIGRGHRVVQMSDHPVDRVVGMFGIWKAGGVYVPVAADVPDERIRPLSPVWSASGSRLWICGKQARLSLMNTPMTSPLRVRRWSTNRMIWLILFSPQEQQAYRKAL
ncbi:Gramicidin S synthase 2 [compost metagenome]